MLPKERRLVSDYDFRMVRRRGRKIGTPLFDLFYFERGKTSSPRSAGYPPSRFGFVVSTKLDKRAVKRNRIKRIFREGTRSVLPKIKDGFDLVFWVRQKSLEAEPDQVRAAIKAALRRGRLLTDG